MLTEVQKWVNSLALRIQMAFALDTQLANDSFVETSIVDGQIIITPGWVLEELLAGIKKIHPKMKLIAALRWELKFSETMTCLMAGKVLMGKQRRQNSVASCHLLHTNEVAQKLSTLIRLQLQNVWSLAKPKKSNIVPTRNTYKQNKDGRMNFRPSC